MLQQPVTHRKTFGFLAVLSLFGLLNACATEPAPQQTRYTTTVTNTAPANSVAAINLQWAEQFLSQQKNQVTTNSGLMYKIIKQGYGCLPTANSHVKVHYQALLADGLKVIDSSYSRGQPSTFPLSKMIPAWREGIPLMPEGSQWEFYVHPRLAYGVKGSYPSIPPNSAMVFTVELLKTDMCAPSFIRG
jgi:FKBP-type peptidyl-prolyl cis-trans isomerase